MTSGVWLERDAQRAIVLKSDDGGLTWVPDVTGGGGSGGGAVASVNGHVGAVTLTASDVSAQPVDADLTAVAALSTASFGRGLLTEASAASARSTLGLGTAAVAASTDFDAAGAAASAQAASQPLDGDLTSIAALTTAAFGRGLLSEASANSARTTLGLGTAATQSTGTFAQVANNLSDVTASTARTNLGLGSMATQAASAVAITGGTLTGITGGMTIGAPNNAVGTSASLAGSISVENGFLGLCFIGTQQADGACTIDLRSHGGTYASPTATPSGTVIGGMHIGSCYGGTGQPALIDSAQIFCVATETHTSTASGTKWDFYTTPNTTNSKAVAFTINQDKSLTAYGALTGATNVMLIDGTTNVATGVFGAIPIRQYGFNSSWNFQRVNGSAGSPTALANADVITRITFGGAVNTTPNVAIVGEIRCTATQTFSAGNGGGKLDFYTTPNASTTAVIALTLGQDQSALFTGTISHASLLNCTSNFAVGTTKFTVAASTGNTVVVGTLDSGDLTANSLAAAQATIGNAVQQLSSIATNDDPTEVLVQGRTTTTGATAPTIVSIATASNTVYMVESKVLARRTGGSNVTGAVGHAVALTLVGLFRNTSGSLAQIGSTTVVSNIKDTEFSAISADIVAAGTNITTIAQGVANTNIVWHATTRYYPLNS